MTLERNPRNVDPLNSRNRWSTNRFDFAYLYADGRYCATLYGWEAACCNRAGWDADRRHGTFDRSPLYRDLLASSGLADPGSAGHGWDRSSGAEERLETAGACWCPTPRGAGQPGRFLPTPHGDSGGQRHGRSGPDSGHDQPPRRSPEPAVCWSWRHRGVWYLLITISWRSDQVTDVPSSWSSLDYLLGNPLTFAMAWCGCARWLTSRRRTSNFEKFRSGGYVEHLLSLNKVHAMPWRSMSWAQEGDFIPQKNTTTYRGSADGKFIIGYTPAPRFCPPETI